MRNYLKINDQIKSAIFMPIFMRDQRLIDVNKFTMNKTVGIGYKKNYRTCISVKLYYEKARF